MSLAAGANPPDSEEEEKREEEEEEEEEMQGQTESQGDVEENIEEVATVAQQPESQVEADVPLAGGETEKKDKTMAEGGDRGGEDDAAVLGGSSGKTEGTKTQEEKGALAMGGIPPQAELDDDDADSRSNKPVDNDEPRDVDAPPDKEKGGDEENKDNKLGAVSGDPREEEMPTDAGVPGEVAHNETPEVQEPESQAQATNSSEAKAPSATEVAAEEADNPYKDIKIPKPSDHGGTFPDWWVEFGGEKMEPSKIARAIFPRQYVTGPVVQYEYEPEIEDTHKKPKKTRGSRHPYSKSVEDCQEQVMNELKVYGHELCFLHEKDDKVVRKMRQAHYQDLDDKKAAHNKDKFCPGHNKNEKAPPDKKHRQTFFCKRCFNMSSDKPEEIRCAVVADGYVIDILGGKHRGEAGGKQKGEKKETWMKTRLVVGRKVPRKRETRPHHYWLGRKGMPTRAPRKRQ